MFRPIIYPSTCFLIISTLLTLASTQVIAEPINAGLLYHNYCSVCHGDNGDAKSRARNSFSPPPRDFTSEQSKAELSRERIIHSITHGRPGTAMGGWSSQISTDEISVLADYLLDSFINYIPVDQSVGKKIFTKNCSVCHGDKGDGGRWTTGLKFPPRNFTASDPNELTRDRMVIAVTHGRSGTPMAPFKSQLTEQQIEQVVDYIRTSFMGVKHREVSGISGTYAHGLPGSNTVQTPVPKAKEVKVHIADHFKAAGLSADAKRGKSLYNKTCFTCHGIKGDGQGPRAYFIRPVPANFLDQQTRDRLQKRTFLVERISKGSLGSEMPAWNKVLTEQQIADVAEYVYTAFLRSEKTTGAKKK